MFGNNPQTKAMHRGTGARLPVRSMFYTIQGEGPHSGRPAVFLRLGGCNLKCWFCDTDFDVDASPEKDVAELAAALVAQLELIKKQRGFLPMLVITGGEPLLYNLGPLLGTMRARLPALKMQIETAGSTVGGETAEAILAFHVDVVCSPKTAKVHPLMAKLVAAWKYVLRAGECGLDGLPIHSAQKQGDMDVLARPTNGNAVYVQPCFEYRVNNAGSLVADTKNNERNAAEVARSCMGHGHIAAVQVHKILEVL